MKRKGERASHIAAALGLAKPRAGPAPRYSARQPLLLLSKGSFLVVAGS